MLIPIILLVFVCESIGQVIPVKPFTPKPIRITVDDLPPPFNTSSASKPAIVVPVPSDATLFVPDGNYRVSVYLDGLQAPRQMIYTPTGDILVTESSGNRISILTGNIKAVFGDITNGISQVFGMAFYKNWFYVASASNLRRFMYTPADRKLHGTGTILMSYPGSGHWTRNLVLAPSGDRLFVSVGSASNVNIEYSPRASVQVAQMNGSNAETFSHGLRNPVGMDFHPITEDLYAVVQERDAIGDDLVPDYFTRIAKDQFYGWPFAYLSSKNVDPRRRYANGSSERPDLVAITRTPDVLFQAHSAALDMRFYRGQHFPIHYRNGAFVALHGSWNRQSGTGYKVVFVPFGNDNRPLGYYEDFLYGFLVDPTGPRTFGRPVGILEMKDGSLLVSDDGNGRLYRIEYTNGK